MDTTIEAHDLDELKELANRATAHRDALEHIIRGASGVHETVLEAAGRELAGWVTARAAFLDHAGQHAPGLLPDDPHLPSSVTEDDLKDVADLLHALEDAGAALRGVRDNAVGEPLMRMGFTRNQYLRLPGQDAPHGAALYKALRKRRGGAITRAFLPNRPER